MAQEIKRPDGIEIVITSVCVPAYVHVGGGVGWGGGVSMDVCAFRGQKKISFILSYAFKTGYLIDSGE